SLKTANRIFRSRDQATLASASGEFVTCCSLLPSGEITYRSSGPFRLEMKAMRLPSRETTGKLPLRAGGVCGTVSMASAPPRKKDGPTRKIIAIRTRTDPAATVRFICKLLKNVQLWCRSGELILDQFGFVNC